MDNILNNKTGILTILLADPVTEIATAKVIEIINNLKNSNTPTLLYKFNSYEICNKLQKPKDIFKNSNIYLCNKIYLEDICETTKNYKYLYDIKYVIIDSLIEISTKQSYCLGRGDIISIIIQELKKLAQELNISILVTAPTKANICKLEKDDIKLLSYFCKVEKAKDYVDKIIILEKEIKNEE